MKKVLVTGGAGFVGRHLVRRLLDRGDQVYVVDNIVEHTGGIDPSSRWPTFDPMSYQTFKFYKEDCRVWFTNHIDDDFDYVFHLAAIVGGRQMIEWNPMAVAEDLAIDAEYWKWAVLAQPRKTICFSSSAAYPINLQRSSGYTLLKEDMISFNDAIGMPDMTYGWAKLTCEYLAKLAYERHGLNSICYRPFSGYGDDQDKVYPFPSICRRVLEQRNQDMIQVWGSGRQMRDFIHIEDCISGILTMMDKIDDAEAVNLSTGLLTSFIELVKIATNIVGFNPSVVGRTDQPEGVFARGGDTTKQANLGFRPTIPLSEGIARGLKFHERLLAEA